MGMPASNRQYEELWLKARIKRDAEYIATKTSVPLNENQYSALCSFIYNLGRGSFAKSTLLKRLNTGNYQAAADELLRWDKARVNGKLQPVAGLSRRRRAERELFCA